MLNDETKKKKKDKKKLLKSTRINLPNSWLGSWDHYNLIERKSKQIMKSNSQSTQNWWKKWKKKVNLKKEQKNDLS